MPGGPVTIGCVVVLSPGVSGPPDNGVIVSVPNRIASSGGMPLATTGAVCQMVNSISGILYSLSIGAGGSAGSAVGGHALLRVGDQIPSGAAMLTIVGPPVSGAIQDS